MQNMPPSQNNQPSYDLAAQFQATGEISYPTYDYDLPEEEMNERLEAFNKQHLAVLRMLLASQGFIPDSSELSYRIIFSEGNQTADQVLVETPQEVEALNQNEQNDLEARFIKVTTEEKGKVVERFVLCQTSEPGSVSRFLVYKNGEYFLHDAENSENGKAVTLDYRKDGKKRIITGNITRISMDRIMQIGRGAEDFG